MRFLISILIVLGFYSLNAQNLEEIKNKKWINYSGNVSINQTYYNSNRLTNSVPYFWQLRSSFNLKIKDLLYVPFSVILTNGKQAINVPRVPNQIGLSPSYKSIKLHLGYRSLNYSEFTMAGVRYNGLGVEFDHQNSGFYLSALKGRLMLLKNRQQLGNENLDFDLPRRDAFGFKTGFKRKNASIYLSLLKSKDKQGDSTFLNPSENLIIGTSGAINIIPRIRVSFDYGYSMFTSNIRSSLPYPGDFSFNNNFGSLFEPNGTTSFSHAYSSDLSFSGNLFLLNLNYRRIDPGYQTHGNTFLTNDFENITSGISFSLFKKSTSVNLNFGAQRNNLKNVSDHTNRRLAFSSYLNISPKENIHFALMHSNYRTFLQKVGIQIDMLQDSIEFMQVNESSSINYSIGLNQRNSFYGSLARQLTENTQLQNLKYHLLQLGFKYSLFENVELSVEGRYNSNVQDSITNKNIGPAILLTSRAFERKLRNTFSINYLKNSVNQQVVKNVIRLSLSNSYQIKQHRISLNSQYIYQHTLSESFSTVRELRIMMNYLWSFNR